MEMLAGEVRLSYETKIKRADLIKIKSAESIKSVLDPFFNEVINYKERMVAVFLSQSNSVLGISIISDGGISGTFCDSRLIFQNALLLNATAFVIAHNHPSGNLTPSEQDRQMTKQLQSAGEIMNIKLLDSLIITENGFTSIIHE
jgi:DNA repair protein RadC